MRSGPKRGVVSQYGFHCTTIRSKAVTETAIEILGTHRQKKKPWKTAEILDLCDKRRELRK